MAKVDGAPYAFYSQFTTHHSPPMMVTILVSAG
jgi:hypothetical protein